MIRMLAKRKWGGGVFLIFAAGCIATPAFAIEITEPAGAAHGYPGLCDINGKKLADGEFRQWTEDHRLYVVITYKFPDGRLFEEKARFRQQTELMQEQWSWKELEHGRPQREFTADFVSGMASAHIRKDNKDVSEQIEVKAVGFSPIPTLKPQVVTVKVSHGGLDRMRMSGRLRTGDRFIIHPEVPAIAKLFINV